MTADSSFSFLYILLFEIYNKMLNININQTLFFSFIRYF